MNTPIVDLRHFIQAIRDSGYKIKQLAEDERRNHIAKGWWDESC